MNIGILDYGVGNIKSVASAIRNLGVIPIFISKPSEIVLVDKVILPGVGGFSECMSLLDGGGWSDPIRNFVLTENKPILGICLGMQLLADYGFEGANNAAGTPGLGLISGSVVHLSNFGCLERIPHMGWNSISKKTDNPLFDGIPLGTDFYFVHSYAFLTQKNESIIAAIDYGAEIPVAVNQGSAWGVQFHPEKSSHAGYRLLLNFLQDIQC